MALRNNYLKGHMDIQLSLTKEEVAAIVQVLGQLPTNSGAWPLLVKIDAQVKAQTEQKETDNG